MTTNGYFQTIIDSLWCDQCEKWTAPERPDCGGHESTSGPIGNVIFCDGTCHPGEPGVAAICSSCGEEYHCQECGDEVDIEGNCLRPDGCGHNEEA